MKSLSVVIPAYNERKTIHLILEKVVKSTLDNIDKEIIVVNDYSSDNTSQAVDDFKQKNPDVAIRLFEQEKNMGKDAALHRGIKEATGDYVLIQDAELENDPNECRVLLRPIVAGNADVVYGKRFRGSNPHKVLFFTHTLGNNFLTFISNLFTNLNLKDMETCYKVFRSEIIKKVKLKEKRFGFKPEVTAKIAKIPGIRIYEVGISYYGRTYADGEKNLLEGWIQSTLVHSYI